MTARTEGRVLALLGIVLLSLGMRSATSSFTPLFPRIDAELSLGPIVLGAVGALPPFAFALAGFVAPWLTRRLGAERTLLIAIAGIVVGQAARGLAGEVTVILAATAVTMFGIGIGNVLLPSIVKRYFPTRIGLLTAVYTVLFAIGGTSPAFFSVPFADVLGWRVTVAVWATTVAFAAVPWIVLARGHRTVDAASATEIPPDALVRIGRLPLSWALTVVLFASAMVGYGCSAWLPLIVADRVGVDDAEAATHLGVVLAVGIPASLLVPLVAARPRPAAAVVAVSGVLATAGWAGLLVAPATLSWLWAAMIGCGALTFPLVLVQVAVRASTPRVAVRLSAFVQAFAYVATGTTVLALGVLHDATDDWTAPIVVLLAIATLPLLAVPFVARPGRVDDPR